MQNEKFNIVEAVKRQILVPGMKDLGNPGVSSRRSFLSRSAVAVAGSAAVFAAGSAMADNNAKSFYRQIQGHENEHVAFLVAALGAAARPKPTFQGLLQRNIKDFYNVSQALENTGTGAYLGAVGFIKDRAYIYAAGAIFAVEARHSGYLNASLQDPITAPASDNQANPSFETGLSPDQVVANAGGFIASLNGGPPVTYSTSDVSDANDLAILNFALALEYLEAEFYNLNVPKFFRGR